MAGDLAPTHGARASRSRVPGCASSRARRIPSGRCDDVVATDADLPAAGACGRPGRPILESRLNAEEKTMPLRAIALAVALAAGPWAEAGTPGGGAGCVESDRTATRHPATWYDTFAGTRKLLNVYEGDRVVFYSPEDLPAEQYSCILAHLEMYRAFAGGAYPLWSPEGFEEKGSVALVENTCGAGCGAGGRAEVLKEYADRSVSRVGDDVSDPRGWQVSYYEMGRGGSSERPPARKSSSSLLDHRTRAPRRMGFGNESAFIWIWA